MLHKDWLAPRVSASGVVADVAIALVCLAAVIAIGVTIVQRPRILIVDDHPDIAEALGVFLRGKGFPTVVAEDGRMALAELVRPNPAVVVPDRGLSDLDGVEVARRLHSLPGGAPVPIIATTGWGPGADRQRALNAGVTQYLVKSVDPLSLLKAIERVLDGESSLPGRS